MSESAARVSTQPTMIVLARHGETTSNTAGRISTQAPGSPLTPAGREQAATLGRTLAQRRPSQVYSSHLIRAVDTARVVADVVGVTPRTDPDLREIDAGELDGRCDPAAYALLDDVLDRWAHGDLDARVGVSGENGHRLVARVDRLMRRWAHEHSGTTVVAIAHGGVIEIAIPHIATNLPLGHRQRNHLPNGGVVELVAVGDGTITCTSWEGE